MFVMKGMCLRRGTGNETVLRVRFNFQVGQVKKL